jgi:hypothetical protein
MKQPLQPGARRDDGGWWRNGNALGDGSQANKPAGFSGSTTNAGKAVAGSENHIGYRLCFKTRKKAYDKWREINKQPTS